MTSPPVMHNEIIIPEAVISDKIYVIRAQKVMLDKDLAELYGVKPIRLREQVRRNINKFPDRFMFQLNETEVEVMVSQNAIPSKQHLGGSLPLVFTEHGILQLSNVLNSKKATEMSINIIDVFIKMRELILSNKDILLELEEIKKKMIAQDEKIEVVFDYLTKFVTQEQEPREQIGFKKSSK